MSLRRVWIGVWKRINSNTGRSLRKRYRARFVRAEYDSGSDACRNGGFWIPEAHVRTIPVDSVGEKFLARGGHWESVDFVKWDGNKWLRSGSGMVLNRWGNLSTARPPAFRQSWQAAPAFWCLSGQLLHFPPLSDALHLLTDMTPFTLGVLSLPLS